MLFSVTHQTEYLYDNFVSYCHNLATLKPREYPGQELIDFQLTIDPLPSDLTERKDFFGNNITRFSIQNQHNLLKVISKSKINRNAQQLTDSFFDVNIKSMTLDTALQKLKVLSPFNLDAQQYTLESPLVRKLSDAIHEYANVSFQPNRSLFDGGMELMKRIYDDFEYVQGYTNVSTPLNLVIEEKKGVCQDFAHVAIACLRSMGIPAKYISGYIETIPPEGMEKLIGADASHAWFSMYIPDYGWIEFDPTNNIIPGNQHLLLAWGRDYYDVPPLKGVFFSNGENKMKVMVDIRKIY